MIMKPLTYRQLFAALSELPDESLDMSVTVLNIDTADKYSLNAEAYPVQETTLVSELPDDRREEVEDMLSLDQPVLVVYL
jgi:hypothetical protein